MNGKSKCKNLKDIRRQIAQDNDIEFVTSECKYQGDCSGTCPKCEAELRYLENELSKRQKAGKAIAVAGIAAALVVGSSGCALEDLFHTSVAGDLAPDTLPSQTSTTEQEQTDPSVPELMGEPIPDPTYEMLPGALPAPTEEILMGDIATWP